MDKAEMDKAEMDKAEVNTLIMDYLLSGMPIAKEDEDDPIMATVIDAIKDIFDTHMPAIRAAAKEYMKTGDMDALNLSLLPVHNLIWYEAYAPYWLLHCKPVDDSDGDNQFTYYNDLIDMYWLWKHQVWSKKEETCVTIMLPPTKGLLTLDYAEAVKSLNNYKRDHQASDGHTASSSTVSSDAEN